MFQKYIFQALCSKIPYRVGSSFLTTIQAPSPVCQVGLKGRLLSGFRCAQIIIRIGAEKIRHVLDGPRVPPLDVAVRGLGGRGVIHPRVHGDSDVGVSDGRETCGANGLRSLVRGVLNTPLD